MIANQINLIRSTLKDNSQAYLDGFSSYPDLRINYPIDLNEEKNWLKGWYHAKRMDEIAINLDGEDTFLWHYKTGA